MSLGNVAVSERYTPGHHTQYQEVRVRKSRYIGTSVGVVRRKQYQATPLHLKQISGFLICLAVDNVQRK